MLPSIHTNPTLWSASLLGTPTSYLPSRFAARGLVKIGRGESKRGDHYRTTEGGDKIERSMCWNVRTLYMTLLLTVDLTGIWSKWIRRCCESIFEGSTLSSWWDSSSRRYTYYTTTAGGGGAAAAAV